MKDDLFYCTLINWPSEPGHHDGLFCLQAPSVGQQVDGGVPGLAEGRRVQPA